MFKPFSPLHNQFEMFTINKKSYNTQYTRTVQNFSNTFTTIRVYSCKIKNKKVIYSANTS